MPAGECFRIADGTIDMATKRKLPPTATPVRLNLAPVVDVTMCLLVFFMVATRMVEQENSRIDLPIAPTAKDAEKQELGNRFVVNVRAGESTDTRNVSYLVQETEIPLSEVLKRLRAEHQRDADVNCVIRADRNLPYKYVQAVMVCCAQANVRKVTFSAIPREGGGG